MPITKRTLLSAGYAECDPMGAEGDPHCVGYFQKKLATVFLNVSFWKFPGERAVQVNFETLATDRELHLDIGMRGVPKPWTVPDLEAYVAALLTRVKRPGQETSTTKPSRA